MGVRGAGFSIRDQHEWVDIVMDMGHERGYGKKGRTWDLSLPDVQKDNRIMPSLRQTLYSVYNYVLNL